MAFRHRILLSGCALALAAASPLRAEPLAVLAAVKGKVEVKSTRGAPAVRAAFGQPLERGDRIVVGAGGSATLFFNDGNVVELGEKSTVTVGGRISSRAQPGAVAGLPGEVFAEVARFVTSGSRQTGLMAQSPLRGEREQSALILAPRQTDLLDDRPAFAWRRLEGAARYRVSLFAEGGALWSREATGLSLDYPADAAPLPRDADYLLEVEALSDRGSLRKESSGFHVLSAAQAAAVRANLAKIRESAGGERSPAACYLSGSYLSGRGLFQDALQEFVALRELHPDSPAPHEALGKVYREVGLTELAAAEFQRALELTRQP